MRVFEGIDVERLRLQRMHFHIVGPPLQPQGEFVFRELGDVDPEGFQGFFLERVKASQAGNAFVFDRQSSTLGRLRRLHRGEDTIGNISSALAREFGRHHNRQMSTGVFMLLDVRQGNHTFFAMMKFDDREVLQFYNQGGQTILRHLQRTFVEDEKAMQKVAIARMQQQGGVPLLVLERSSRKNGTEYFRAFLDATRQFDSTELTKRVDQAIKDAAAELRGLIPEEQLSGYLARAREYCRQEAGLDEESRPRLETRVFGPDPNGLIQEKVSKHFRLHKIEGEAFQFDHAAVRPSPHMRIKTVEDITVTYAPEHQDKIDQSVAGQIIIHTEGIREQSDVPD